MTVSLERLADWDPKDTVKKALELCRERIALENNRRMQQANSITTASEMSRFYEHNYDGYIKGYSRGYYNAPNSISFD